ncbi:MAG: hypothetical protein AAGJ69_12170, partial [Cyanobacteria bacterium J06559_1]
LSKWRGTKVVWTIHDEKPHVVLHQQLADWFTQRLIANTDGCIHLCGAGRKAVNQSMPDLAELQQQPKNQHPQASDPNIWMTHQRLYRPVQMKNIKPPQQQAFRRKFDH